MLIRRRDGSWGINHLWEPYEFHPYTSIIPFDARVFNTARDRPEEDLQEQMTLRFQEAGIRAWRDNKVVFGFRSTKDLDRRLYLGFYDLEMTLGTGVWWGNAERTQRSVLLARQSPEYPPGYFAALDYEIQYGETH